MFCVWALPTFSCFSCRVRFFSWFFYSRFGSSCLPSWWSAIRASGLLPLHNLLAPLAFCWFGGAGHSFFCCGYPSSFSVVVSGFSSPLWRAGAPSSDCVLVCSVFSSLSLFAFCSVFFAPRLCGHVLVCCLVPRGLLSPADFAPLGGFPSLLLPAAARQPVVFLLSCGGVLCPPFSALGPPFFPSFSLSALPFCFLPFFVFDFSVFFSPCGSSLAFVPFKHWFFFPPFFAPAGSARAALHSGPLVFALAALVFGPLCSSQVPCRRVSLIAWFSFP